MGAPVQQTAKHGVDGLAAIVTGGAILGWLPHISAALGILWFTIQIVEKLAGKPFSELVRGVWRRVRHGA